MSITAFATGGSRKAAAATALLLLFGAPIVNGAVADRIVQATLLLIIAVSIGAALGWIAGETIVQSRGGGKALVILGALAAIALGALLPLHQLRSITSLAELRLQFFELFALPAPDGGITPAIRYATIAFALVALVATLLAPRREPEQARASAGSDRPRDWAAMGNLATALTLLLGVHAFIVSQVRWQQEVAIRAIADENMDRPYVSRHCLKAVYELRRPQLEQVYNREPVVLEGEQPEFMRRCFADHDEVEMAKLYRRAPEPAQAYELTPKGTALLAQRVNYTLAKDDVVAGLMKYGIADEALVASRFRTRVCGIEKELVLSLSRTPLGDLSRPLYTEQDPLLWLVTSKFCDPPPTRTTAAGR